MRYGRHLILWQLQILHSETNTVFLINIQHKRIHYQDHDLRISCLRLNGSQLIATMVQSLHCYKHNVLPVPRKYLPRLLHPFLLMVASACLHCRPTICNGKRHPRHVPHILYCSTLLSYLDAWSWPQYIRRDSNNFFQNRTNFFFTMEFLLSHHWSHQ